MSIKISELPSGTTSSGTDEFPANQGGTTKKSTLNQMASYVLNAFSSLSLAGVAQTVKSAIDALATTLTTLSDFIGNTSMGTTATTVTGAIAEHEGDITLLNSNFAYKIFEVNNISFEAGTPGTRGWQTYFDISLAGYNVLSYGLFYVSNSNAANYVPFMSDGDSYPNRLYVNAYRGVTWAVDSLSIKIKVVYTKLPITALT